MKEYIGEKFLEFVFQVPEKLRNWDLISQHSMIY